MKTEKLLCFLLSLALLLGIFSTVCAAEEPEFHGVIVSYDGKDEKFASTSDAWNKAVSLASSKEVKVTLYTEWVSNPSGSLGSGDGFRDGAIQYNKSKNLTLDLNGYRIDRMLSTPKDGGAVIYVDSTLTIIDSDSNKMNSNCLVKGGIITGGANNERGGGIVVSDNSTLNFNGGTIMSCVSTDDGGAISVIGSGAKLNVNGGSFYGNRTFDASGECCGGAIYADDSTLNINNAVFESNYSEDEGGTIYIDDGSLTVKNSLFHANYAREQAGGIFIDGSTHTRLENCTFTNNRGDEDGGAIYADSSTGTEIYNCDMYYNSTGEKGGAVYINADRVFLIGGTYRFNSSSSYGGGVYVDSLYDCNIAGKLIIKDNKAGDSDRDLCLQNGSFSTGHIYCGGLYEGSSVYLCSTGNSSHFAIKGIDKYQYNNYIHFNSGDRLDRLEESDSKRDNLIAEGSVINSGNIITILIMLAISVVTGILVYFISRKGKGVKEVGNP